MYLEKNESTGGGRGWHYLTRLSPIEEKFGGGGDKRNLSGSEHHRHQSPSHPCSKLDAAPYASPRATLLPPFLCRPASTRHPTPPPPPPSPRPPRAATAHRPALRPGCPHRASPWSCTRHRYCRWLCFPVPVAAPYSTSHQCPSPLLTPAPHWAAAASLSCCYIPGAYLSYRCLPESW
jgi:hypothetical protein